MGGLGLGALGGLVAGVPLSMLCRKRSRCSYSASSCLKKVGDATGSLSADAAARMAARMTAWKDFMV